MTAMLMYFNSVPSSFQNPPINYVMTVRFMASTSKQLGLWGWDSLCIGSAWLISVSALLLNRWRFTCILLFDCLGSFWWQFRFTLHCDTLLKLHYRVRTLYCDTLLKLYYRVRTLYCDTLLKLCYRVRTLHCDTLLKLCYRVRTLHWDTLLKLYYRVRTLYCDTLLKLYYRVRTLYYVIICFILALTGSQK
jgi:hypothetical protein